MRPSRALIPAICVVALAALASACGGGGATDAKAPDSDKIPTATLPATLPDATIIGGGAVQPGGGTTYTIRAGDTLAAIADRFGLSLEELVGANPGLDPATLAVGDAVQLPQIEGVPPTQEPETAPTEEPAPAETATTEPAADPPTETPPPAPAATNTPTSLGQTYVVQSGDIPVNIAAQFGITVEALLAANPGINANSLQVGDVLIIPAAPPPGPPA